MIQENTHVLNEKEQTEDQELKCNSHKDEKDVQFEGYCMKCEGLYCVLCVNENIHQGHHTKTFDEYLIQAKSESKKFNKRLSLVVETFNLNIKFERNKFETDIRDQYLRQLDFVSREFREMHDMLHVKEVQLKRELKSYYEENEEIFAMALSGYENKLQYFSTQMEKFAEIDLKVEETNAHITSFILEHATLMSELDQNYRDNIGYQQNMVDNAHINSIKSAIEMIAMYPFNNIANKTTNGTVTTNEYPHKAMNQLELYQKCLELDPQFVKIYYNLALNTNGYTIFVGQRQMGAKELYIKAIESDPEEKQIYYLHQAYNNLGIFIDNDEVLYVNGKEFTKLDLFFKSLSMNPLYANVFNNLGNMLSNSTDVITMPDGTSLNRKELYLRALEINPLNAAAYNNLSYIASAGELIELPNGTKLSKRDLHHKYNTLKK